MLVLQFQAFHKMTEDGEGCICEVWCGKGDADSIEEWWNSMLRTVTMLDFSLECGQMLNLRVDRRSTFQSSECSAGQGLHIVNHKYVCKLASSNVSESRIVKVIVLKGSGGDEATILVSVLRVRF